MVMDLSVGLTILLKIDAEQCLFLFAKLVADAGRHWKSIAVAVGMVAGVWGLVSWLRRMIADSRWNRRIRLELEAYASFDVRPYTVHETEQVYERENVQALAKQVCRLVTKVSAFRNAAMLTQDPEGRLVVTGSAGMDDLAVAALNEWGAGAMPLGPRLRRPEGDWREGGPEMRARAAVLCGVQPLTSSFVLDLKLGAEPALDMRPRMESRETSESKTVGKGAKLQVGNQRKEGRLKTDRTLLPTGAGAVWVAPLWTLGGRMVGALAVCGRRERDDQHELENNREEMLPLEALAAKLAQTLENAALTERLFRAEKLAGLGQLAGGVAHALNGPLTAVMGFAELIAETTEETRVQEDATTIMREAMRIRDTVQSLVEVWRPAVLIEEAVSITGMVGELAKECRPKLEARGVRLAVEMSEEAAEVRGNRDRLRQVMEHLLNNAAQAVAAAEPGSCMGDAGASGHPNAVEHAIRVTVRKDDRGVQVIVSDTGPGFREAAQVFDPFYMRQDAGVGLGLSICYGIVREHGGQISAFNLHPLGAAVVVELPVGK